MKATSNQLYELSEIFLSSIIITIAWLWVRIRQYRRGGLMESARINPKILKGTIYLSLPEMEDGM